MYKAVRDFRDLMDGGYFYNAGDSFPRIGLEVDADRLKELSTNENKSRMVLIEYVEDEPVAEVAEPKKEKEKVREKNARAGAEGSKKLLHS